MVLRVGGKFAIEPPLKPELVNLTEQAFRLHHNAVQKLSRSEAERHKCWKDAILHSIETRVPEPKLRRRSLMLAKGIRHLRDLNVVVKLADKNLGMTAMAGPVYRRGLEERHWR